MTGEQRNVYVLLCLACLTISFNVAAITAVIPVISRDLVLSDFLVSKIIAYYLMPYGVGALLYAPLTQKYSYRSIFLGTLSVFVVCCVWCGSTPDLSQMLWARVGMGLAAASVIPLALMIIGNAFEASVRGRLVGGFFSMAFIASLTGVVVSSWIDWRFLFFIPAGLGFFTGIGFLQCSNPILHSLNSHPVNYLRTLRNPQILKIFIFIFILSFLYHAVHKWYGVFFDRIYAMTPWHISLFFSISVVSGFIGQLSGGIISDKKGRFWACGIGLIGLATCICALGFKNNLFGLAALVAGISFFWTVGHNGISTVLTDFSNRDRAAVASLNSSIRFLAGGLGFYLSRPWVEWSFLNTFFGIGLALFVVSLVLKIVIPPQIQANV